MCNTLQHCIKKNKNCQFWFDDDFTELLIVNGVMAKCLELGVSQKYLVIIFYMKRYYRHVHNIRVYHISLKQVHFILPF